MIGSQGPTSLVAQGWSVVLATYAPYQLNWGIRLGRSATDDADEESNSRSNDYWAGTEGQQQQSDKLSLRLVCLVDSPLDRVESVIWGFE